MLGKHYVGRDLTGFENNGKTRPISRVTLTIDDENAVTAGDDSGLEITATCPHATQEMAENILKKVKGYQYQMYTADAANIDPAAELGDGITADGVYGVISRVADDGGGYPDLTGPGEAELEDEFPAGDGPMTKEINRKLGGVRSYITKTAEQIRLEVSEEVSGLTTAFDVKLDGIRGEITDAVNGVSTTFDAKLGEISARVESVGNKAAEDLSKYSETVTKSLGELQSQIDGSITTWFYDYEPTSKNEPASLWTTDDEKIKHLGDVFYIVDNAEKGGQAYRWEYVGGEYRWSLIEDVEVAKALADAAKAQDTADKKRRVFTSQPIPPYDVGDLWTQGPNGDLMRCNTKRESGSFSAPDWGLASKYTDDSALDKFLSGDYKRDLENLQSQADQKAETWYQDADPSGAWNTDTLKAEHKGDMWYCTDANNATRYQKFWRWSGSGWQEMTSTPPETVFDRIDGKAQIFISQPKPPYRKGDLWFNSDTSDIMTCVADRLNGDYATGDWEKRNKYTDDSYAAERYAELNVSINSINTAVKGLDGRATKLEQTDQSFRTEVDGLGGRLTTVEQTAEGLSTSVSGLGGRLTTVEQTAEGLTSTVQGLGGQFSTLEQTVNGFTFRDESGKVWINNGNINLTGIITWDDLNSSVQSSINNRGVSAATVHTLIKQDLVASPNIAGGKFYELTDSGALGETWLEIGPPRSTSNGGLVLKTTTGLPAPDNNELFVVFNGDFGMGGMEWKGYRFLFFDDTYIGNVFHRKTCPWDVWDFSNATVTGLKFA